MSVRILAKKAYDFRNEDKNEPLTCKVEPLIVSTVPDWVTATDLFKLAFKHNNIELMTPVVNNNMSIGEIEELQAKAKEYSIKNYKNMKPDTLKKKIEEYEQKQEQETTNAAADESGNKQE